MIRKKESNRFQGFDVQFPIGQSDRFGHFVCLIRMTDFCYAMTHTLRLSKSEHFLHLGFGRLDSFEHLERDAAPGMQARFRLIHDCMPMRVYWKYKPQPASIVQGDRK